MSATGVGRPKRLVVLGMLPAAFSLVLAIGVPAARAAAFPGFDDQASQFKIFWDCSSSPCPQNGSVTDVPSPSEDGDALNINYASGNQSYEGLDAYIPLGTDASALRYQVNYDFYFPNRTPVQALEFCMNNYFGGKRYQWCMQWENIGTGAPQWRIWGGADSGVKWKSIGISDNNINPGTWYTLTIDGNIIGGQVHYLDFIIHGTTHSLTQYTFPPDSSSGPGLVAAVQVDGDSHADPYHLYIDNAHYYWSNTAKRS
ncbi:MAG TPA: hypothetical protein VKS82_10145 [Streptosporangiaceae bacterium]|nr:hypothetical protein [Streptosporangiaceae bacterium]